MTLSSEDLEILRGNVLHGKEFADVEQKCISEIRTITEQRGKDGIKQLLLSNEANDLILRQCFDYCFIGRLQTHVKPAVVCFLCYGSIGQDSANSHIVGKAMLKRLRNKQTARGSDVVFAVGGGSQVAYKTDAVTATLPLFCQNCDNRMGDLIEKNVFMPAGDRDLTDCSDLHVLRYAVAHSIRVYCSDTKEFCKYSKTWSLVDKLRRYLLFSLWGWSESNAADVIFVREFDFWSIPMPDELRVTKLYIKFPIKSAEWNKGWGQLKSFLKSLIFLNSKATGLQLELEDTLFFTFSCTHMSAMFLFALDRLPACSANEIERFAYRSDLQWALRGTSIPAAGQVFQCTDCYSSFTSNNQLHKHIKNVHAAQKVVGNTNVVQPILMLQMHREVQVLELEEVLCDMDDACDEWEDSYCGEIFTGEDTGNYVTLQCRDILDSHIGFLVATKLQKFVKDGLVALNSDEVAVKRNNLTVNAVFTGIGSNMQATTTPGGAGSPTADDGAVSAPAVMTETVPETVVFDAHV